MLNFFNNIIKKIDIYDKKDEDVDVKEHYIKYRSGNENDTISTILFVLFIVFFVAESAYELWHWNDKKQQNLIKTNHVVNGLVPSVPVSRRSLSLSLSTSPAVPVTHGSIHKTHRVK